MMLRHDEGARTLLSFESSVAMPHHLPLPTDLTVDYLTVGMQSGGLGCQPAGWGVWRSKMGEKEQESLQPRRLTRDGLGLVVLCEI